MVSYEVQYSPCFPIQKAPMLANDITQSYLAVIVNLLNWHARAIISTKIAFECIIDH